MTMTQARVEALPVLIGRAAARMQALWQRQAELFRETGYPFTGVTTPELERLWLSLRHAAGRQLWLQDHASRVLDALSEGVPPLSINRAGAPE